MRKLFILVFLSVTLPTFAAVTHVSSGQGFCNGGAHGGNMVSNCNGTATNTFTFTPTHTGDGFLVALDCGATSATPSAVTLAATGWTVTKLVPSGGSASGIVGSTTNGFSAVFWGYTPNTSAATFTVTWTVSAGGCSNFMNDLIDTFAGMDATNFLDNNSATGNSATGSSGCALSITPVAANDGIWFACQDNITAVTGAYTKGADDTQSDWSEWKIISGTGAQSAGFTSSGTMTIFGVAIKPASGAVTIVPRHRGVIFR